MLRKLVIAAVLLALLAGVTTVAWQACGMPPLRLVLKYGYPSPMGPTGRTLTIEGVEFVEISPGYFRMGSHYLCDQGDLLGRFCAALGLPWGRQPVHKIECPVHWVELVDGFWIARTELTLGAYRLFDPHHEQGDLYQDAHHPALEVDWRAAWDYCAWLKAQSCLPISLPSESTWECACRAGSLSEYSFGDDLALLAEYAVYAANSDGRLRKVASEQANRWGLFDLHGNAWEWCDSQGHEYPDTHPCEGHRAQHTPRRPRRGGGWLSSARECRSAHSSSRDEQFLFCDLGFRPAFVLCREE